MFPLPPPLEGLRHTLEGIKLAHGQGGSRNCWPSAVPECLGVNLVHDKLLEILKGLTADWEGLSKGPESTRCTCLAAITVTAVTIDSSG